MSRYYIILRGSFSALLFVTATVFIIDDRELKCTMEN
jgi:hypothetical protein